jgi:hypothetical protein
MNMKIPIPNFKMMRPAAFGLASGLLLLSSGVSQAATNGIPGPEDYSAFSRFITDRNIFDPARQPHIYSSTTRYRPRRTIHSSSGVPGVQLVGTMSYAKGIFAFFNGSTDDLRKTLEAGDKIAGYTIAEITPDEVLLKSDTNQIPLRVGDGLRPENGKWVFAPAGELSITSGGPATSGSSSSESSSSAPAAPASESAPNDILKRLMQQREKENQ